MMPPMRARATPSLLLVLLATIGLGACAAPAPLRTVPAVDLERFAGDWYVLAHIPAPGEEEAFNGVESYELLDRRTIRTTYRYRVGGFDGPLEVLEPTAFVRDPVGNAYWGMEFFWPLTFEYRITWLDPAYETTIIARTARDYAWIMARTPELPDDRYAELVAALRRQGYDISKLRRVPQRWPEVPAAAAG
jgi:apolipoprotein D and lipocalin family protein